MNMKKRICWFLSIIMLLSSIASAPAYADESYTKFPFDDYLYELPFENRISGNITYPSDCDGKPYIVVYGRLTCSNTGAYLRNISRIISMYNLKDSLSVLYFDYNQPFEVVRSYMEEENLSHINSFIGRMNVWGPLRDAGLSGADTLPFVFYIDAEGECIATTEGTGKMDGIIDNVILLLNRDFIDNVDIALYDSDQTLKISRGVLQGITDGESAANAVNTIASGITRDQKSSASAIDMVTLFAEEALLKSASKEVLGGSITINQRNTSELQKNASDAKNLVEKALIDAGITPQREMDENIAFLTENTSKITITVDSSAANITADNVRIETPEYSIALSKEMIEENTTETPLIITITESRSISMLDGEGTAFVAAAKRKSYDVKFNKSVKEDIKVSLPVPDGDNSYMAVFDEGGYAVGGKYNPSTDKIDVKINTAGTYTVKENKKDFSDIQSKSAEMQEAIRVLSSKGIINGTTETMFSPDSTITRAQIAQLITKTLSKLDANADGGFSDVQKVDWFFGAAGSAKACGIMSGTSETTFSPSVNIAKDQIVAVSARVLRNEMNYKEPSNANSMLSKYSDRNSIPDWARTDVALATQLNLVVYRTDGNFVPTGTMTRGDAAVILYRMFMNIW